MLLYGRVGRLKAQNGGFRPGQDKGRAFAVGFIRACIQAAYAEHVRRGANVAATYVRAAKM